MGSFYVKDPKLRPLQTYLRYAILVYSNIAEDLGHNALADPERFTEDPRVVLQLLKATPGSVKLAFVVLTTVPIIIVYPFLQRFFIKGMLIGSIKG